MGTFNDLRGMARIYEQSQQKKAAGVDGPLTHKKILVMDEASYFSFFENMELGPEESD